MIAVLLEIDEPGEGRDEDGKNMVEHHEDEDGNIYTGGTWVGQGDVGADSRDPVVLIGEGKQGGAVVINRRGASPPEGKTRFRELSFYETHLTTRC